MLRRLILFAMRLLLISNGSQKAIELHDWLQRNHDVAFALNPPLKITDLHAHSMITGDERLDGIIEFEAFQPATYSSRSAELCFAHAFVQQYRPSIPHVLLASDNYAQYNALTPRSATYRTLHNSTPASEIIELLIQLTRETSKN